MCLKIKRNLETIYYRKYPDLVRIEVEIIYDPNYLVRILFERLFSRQLIECTLPTFPEIQKKKK